MSLRDILVLVSFVVSLPYCFIRPWIGILVWYIVGFLNPHRLTWGVAFNMPFAAIVAAVTLAGLTFTRDRSSLPRIKEVILLLSLWCIFLLSTIFSSYPEIAWDQFYKVSKILLMTFVTIVLFQDYKKFRILIWIVILSLGFYGFKGGIWAILSGGQYMLTGPDGTFINGNTNLGLALNMMLPIFYYSGRNETSPVLRRLLFIIFSLSIVAVISTYSRGAFIGLATVLVLISITSRWKTISIGILVISVLSAPLVIPQKWFEKMDTIQTYEEDASAMARITVWKLSYAMALDNPLLGGGFDSFSKENYLKYLSFNDLQHADIGTGAHSIFFQVLGEHGFAGLGLYVILLLATMMTLRHIKQLAKRHPSIEWAFHYAQMIEISLIGFIVSGFFLSMCYFDLFYLLIAFVIILKKLVLNEMINNKEIQMSNMPQTYSHKFSQIRFKTGEA